MEKQKPSENKIDLNDAPDRICYGVIGNLSEIISKVSKEGEDAEFVFMEIFKTVWDNNESGEDLIHESNNKFSSMSNNVSHEFEMFLYSIEIACAYACQGIKYYKNGRVNLTWPHAAKAQYWNGIVTVWGDAIANHDELLISDESIKKIFQDKVASFRHKDNRKDREFVIKHYMENKGKEGYDNKNQAAATMAHKIVSFEYSTIRKILTGL